MEGGEEGRSGGKEGERMVGRRRGRNMGWGRERERV